MHRTIHTILFCLVATLFSFMLPTSEARSQEPAASVSVQELDEALGLIENPKKREAFVKDLKALLAAKKALDEKGKGGAGQDTQELRLIRWVSERFETMLADVRTAVKRMVDVVLRIPDGIQNIQGFFDPSDNRLRLVTLSLNAGLAAIIGLMASFLLARPSRYAAERRQTLPSKIAWGTLQILLKAAPYLISFTAFSLLAKFRPSLSSGTKVLFLFFVLLFFYRTAIVIFQVVFSPEVPHRRIVPISDDNAQYLWIWTRRFAMYAFFYFMATRTVMWLHMLHPFLTFLNTALLIPFPVILTVFVLQIARDIRATTRRMELDDKTGETRERHPIRLPAAFIRYWPIIALGYIWAIFISLMLHYDKGFEYLYRATLGTAVTLLAMLGCFRGLDLISRRFFRVNEKIEDRFPGMEEKANRYLRMVRKSLSVIVVGMGIGTIGEAWGVPFFAFVASDTGGMIILRILTVALTLAVVVCVMEMTNTVSAHLLKGPNGGPKKEISQKQKTLIPVIRTAINIGAGFVGGIIILDRLGVNTTPILAGAGIVGLAVGFGSQALVKDLINGLFILFEESIRVGDWAMVGNQGGMVESVGLRTVKLRDMNGTVHIIPNSTIDSLSNFSKLYSRTVMDIGIAYREDVDEVIEILKELGQALQKDPEYGPDIMEPLEIFGLDRFEDSAVIIRARFKTKPLKQWGVRREFYRRLKRVFDQRGIEIPFPHQTIYMGEPKKGKSAPLHVTIEEGSKTEKAGPQKAFS